MDAQANSPVAMPGHAPRNLGLDAARVLASGSVMAAHFSAIFLPIFGFAVPVWIVMAALFGVELFFVLSGFLIGRLLLQIAAADPTPRGWLIFMVRRWMRTLPLYYLWLAVMALTLPRPPHFAARLLSFVTMTQNLAWPMPADQWFNASWSLTIEEWFYLSFSAALLAVVALARSQRAIWPAILAFIAVPAAARLLQPASQDFEDQVYHLVVLRLDAIAYGVALAKLQADGSRLFRYPLTASALGAALVAAFWIQDSFGAWLNLGRMAYENLQLFGISVGLCLVMVGMVRLRLRLRPLIWLIRAGSRLSYGVYIMHLAIINMVAFFAIAHGFDRVFVLVGSLVLSVVLPALAYLLIEAPLMARRPAQFQRPEPFVARPALGAG